MSNECEVCRARKREQRALAVGDWVQDRDGREAEVVEISSDRSWVALEFEGWVWSAPAHEVERRERRRPI